MFYNCEEHLEKELQLIRWFLPLQTRSDLGFRCGHRPCVCAVVRRLQNRAGQWRRDHRPEDRVL